MTTEIVASEKMLRWQYKKLIGNLLLLQEHSTDLSCPCELTEESEDCIPKHLTVIESYCTETIPMTDNEKARELLQAIAGGADDLSRSYQEAPEDKRPYAEITEFARESRKALEPYLFTYKEVSAKQEFSPPSPFMTLSEIKKYEPEMTRLKVSEVARSPRGFLTAYKRAGSTKNLSDSWIIQREAFIARHLAQYNENPTYRRKLALIAWAYMPSKKARMEEVAECIGHPLACDALEKAVADLNAGHDNAAEYWKGYASGCNTCANIEAEKVEAASVEDIASTIGTGILTGVGLGTGISLVRWIASKIKGEEAQTFRTSRLDSNLPIYQGSAKIEPRRESRIEEEAVLEASEYKYKRKLPDYIEVFSNTISKHYYPSSDCHKGSVRTLKPKADILVVIGCLKKDSWDASEQRCEPNPTVIQTIVPNNEKYTKELEHLKLVHPEIKIRYRKEEETEARASEDKELEQIKQALKEAKVS